MTVLFVVGPPGAGKTTLCRELLGEVRMLVGPEKWTVAENRGRLVVAAGHYDGGTFDGADRVPYNGVSAALDAWAAQFRHADLTLFDGDRFSHAAAVDKLKTLGATDVRCLVIDLDADTLQLRRRARGSQQNEAWAKGRATKAARFWQSFGASERIRVDGLARPDVTARLVLGWLGFGR